MIDTIIKLVQEALKLKTHHDEKKEDEIMQAIADQLRRTSQANAANVIPSVPGTDEDRFLARIAAKGYLVRTHHGFMLPDFAPSQRSGGLY